MSARPDNEDYVLRHIYTSVEKGVLEPGFQTVACAGDLREEQRLKAIEKLVENYKNLEGGGPPCRQLLPLPGTSAYALTVFTPLPDSPGSKVGNVWAETLVVPQAWLERGGWDAAAAFDHLRWWGPDKRGELTGDLPREPLSALSPGPVERLSRLLELVPSLRLGLLLLAVIQQSDGLRPIHLLEAQENGPSDLQDVITLLPLVVPPACRTYWEGDYRRCLSFRTRCPLGGMAPSTDLTGHPAAAEDSLNTAGVVLIDLAGGLLAPEFSQFGRDYAQWLEHALKESEWEMLASVYKEADNFPGRAFFSKFKSILEGLNGTRGGTTAPKRAAAPEHAAVEENAGGEPTEAAGSPPGAAAEEPTISSPVQARQQAWAARNQMEGALMGVLESHENQLQELIEILRKDFAAEVNKARVRLQGDVASIRQSLQEDLQKIQKDIKDTGNQAQRQSASGSAIKTKLEKLEREVAGIKKRLVKLEEAGGTLQEAPAASEADEVSSEEDVPQEPLLRDRLRDWVSDHRKFLWGGVIAIVLSVFVLLILRWSGSIPPHWFDPNESSAQKEKLDTLLQRVQPGKSAARLLASAAQEKDVASQVHAFTLALALNHGIQINESVDCALLQTALSVSVDGGCGSKTIEALIDTPKNQCCQSFQEVDTPQNVKKLWNCFVTDHLQSTLQAGPQVEACGGESPWRKGRSWTESEASQALTLFRRASLLASSDPELAQALRSLDPSESPSLRQRLGDETLSRPEAKRVLELVWTASFGRGDRLVNLSWQELEDLGKVIDYQIEEGAPSATDGTVQ